MADPEITKRLASWGAGPTSPVSEAVHRLFPTFLDMFEFVERTYTGLVYGDVLRAEFASGTGNGSAGHGSSVDVSFAADFRLAYDMGIQRDADELELFSVFIIALNRSGHRGKMESVTLQGEVTRTEVYELLRQAGVADARPLAIRHNLFAPNIQKGVKALLEEGLAASDITILPVDYRWTFDDAEGDRYSVNEAILLHKAGVPAAYSTAMAEAFLSETLPPIEDYWRAGIPAEYAAACLRAGRGFDEPFALWKTGVPLEYALA